MSLISIVARENVPAWRAVTADGFLANTANLVHDGRVLGVSASGATATKAMVVATGSDLVTCPVWDWAPGFPIFVSGTTLSHTPPATGWRQVVGLAASPTQMIVNTNLPELNGGASVPNKTTGCMAAVWLEGEGEARQFVFGEESGPASHLLWQINNVTNGKTAEIWVEGTGDARQLVCGNEYTNGRPLLPYIYNLTTAKLTTLWIEGTSDARQVLPGNEL